MPNPFVDTHAFKAPPHTILPKALPVIRTEQQSLYSGDPTQSLQLLAPPQAERCTDCGIPNCETTPRMQDYQPGCELNRPHEWLGPMARGDWEMALTFHNRTSKLGFFYGLLCPAPCERGCTHAVERGGSGAVNIHQNEAALYIWAIHNGKLVPEPITPRNGKKIAVIGSGVAGLESADLLNKLGYSVVVFESKSDIGGILRWEIPHYKFPEQFSQRDMVAFHRGLFEKCGITFECNASISGNEDVARLKKEFDGIIIASGAPVARYLPLRHGVPKHPHITNASAFLESLKAEGEGAALNPRNKRVMIIGNRDTAADVIGISLRQGAQHVLVLDKYPVDKDQVRNQSSSHEELYATARGEVLGNITVNAITRNESDSQFIVTLAKFDPMDELAQGARGHSPAHGVQVINTDIIVMAIGYTGAEKRLVDSFGLQVQSDSMRIILANPKSGATEIPNIWVAGDATIGPSILMQAGASGRRVAVAVDQALRTKFGAYF